MAALSEVKNFMKRERLKRKMRRADPSTAVLRAALDCCLHQIDQMRGMFPDDDGIIAAAVKAGEDALAGKAGQAGRYNTFGYALAMRVMQSELYCQLDDRERAECDELIQRGMA